MSLPVETVLSARDSRTVTAARGARQAEWAVFGAILFAVLGHLLIKFGLIAAAQTAPRNEAVVHRLLRYVLQPAVFFGLGIYALGTLLWVLAVSKREISYLFPLSAMNYVLVAIGGMVLFGEAIPAGRWVGILVVVAGVVLMQWWGRGESR
jgi:drug/metabolite transporter (DMT)-like permease